MTREEMRQCVRAWAQNEYGAGHHIVALCPRCGTARWVSTRTGDPDGVTIELMGLSHTCDVCAEIYRRYPELRDWVLSVVRMAQLRDEAQP